MRNPPPALEPLIKGHRWVIWKKERRGGKWTKPPYMGKNPKRLADITNPLTWCSYEEAACAVKNGEGKLGVVLPTEEAGAIISGIDLDKCRDPETAELLPWVEGIIEKAAGAYVEVSPSGTGLHVIGWSTGGKLSKRIEMPSGGHIELYRRAVRYLTVTGQQVGRCARLTDITSLIDILSGLSGEKESRRDSTESALFHKQVCELIERKGLSVDAIVADIETHPKRWAKCKVDRFGAREGGVHGEVERSFKKWKEKHSAEAEVAADIIEELNAKHALIVIGGKAAVMKPATATSSLELMQVQTFRQWYANRTTFFGKKPLSVADYWLQHPDRRQYEGIVFAPGAAVPSNCYNPWQGFAVEPRTGDCSKFLAHIRDSVCCGSPRRFEWVMSWFAQMFQQPDVKSGTALVLRGKEGVGKSKIGEVIGSLLGPHYLSVSEPRYVTGRFNAHLTTCLLLHADEAFWAGDQNSRGKLYDIITGHKHPIEFKGKEAIWIDNYVRVFITGNHDWLVPAGPEARRFAVFDVAEDRMRDYGYFSAIDKEMAEGGREALLHYLLNLDITKVNLREVLPTNALLDQKLASLSPEQAWWLDILQRGKLPDARDEANVCPCSSLFGSYIAHAERQGARRRVIEIQLGRFIAKYVPGLHKEGRERRYRFPPLAECREALIELLNQRMVFDAPDEWIVHRRLKIGINKKFDC